MNNFGISLFEQPEHFIAVYLGMHRFREVFLQHVGTLLHRTKSPPLAITYTFHFLKDKSEEELSLDVIRFVSQLADVSSGVSMSSSLHGLLTESAFLTELRHSLTHKAMVKGSILFLSRKLILGELEQKYWKVGCQKLKATYHLSESLVKQYYSKIYSSSYQEDLSWLVQRYPLDYYLNCSNYQYKEHIAAVLSDFKEGILSGEQFTRYYDEVNAQKQAIFMVTMLQDYLRGQNQSEHYSFFVLRCAENMKEELFQNELVRREFLKAYFFKYLNHAGSLYEALSNDFKMEVERFWKRKEEQIGKLY